MSDELKEYSQRLKRFHELDCAKLDDISDENEKYKKVLEILAEKKQIKDSNDAFLEKYVYAFEKDNASMTEADIENLRVIFDSLRSSVNHEFYDRVVSYHIACLVFKYNLDHENWNLCIRQIYHMMYFSSTIFDHSHEKEMDDYSIIIEFILQNYYDCLDDLAKEIAICIILNCTYFPIEKSKALQRFTRAEYFMKKYGIAPENNKATILYSYRAAMLDAMNQMVEAVTEKGYVLSESEIAECRRLLNFSEKCSIGKEYDYIENPARLICIQMHFHLGDINIEQALEQLQELRKVQKGSSNLDKSTLQFHLPSVYLDYVWNYTNYSKEKKIQICLDIIDDVIRDCSADIKSRDNFYSLNGVPDLVLCASRNLGFDKTKTFVLNLTVYENRYLYIHTIIVREIAHVILKYIMENNPDYVIGVAGVAKEEVVSKKEFLLDLMDDCALFHDVGKYFCLDYVSNSSRSLCKEEIYMIKYHTENFDAFFSRENDVRFNCIRDCARLHHRWFDESAGYPECAHTYNKPFVNILSVADCIDAASDEIGRSYNDVKNLDELIAEFDGYRNTRYDSFIIDVLSKPEVYSEIQKFISIEHRIKLSCFSLKHGDF